MDKISYALGLSMGQNLMGSGVTSLNYQDLAQGIEDVLTKQQPKITYQEAQQVLGQFFQELEAKIAGAAKADGEKFLAENAKREGVQVTASGLQYEVLEATIGQKPKATDKVRVHYEGTLIDGTVFDSTEGESLPALFPICDLIMGWQIALVRMHEGDKWEVYIPAKWGYGAQNLPDIPAHSTLIFTLELVKVERY